MQRFFISHELIKENKVFFPSDLAHQLSRVLRLREGARVIVLDNSGMEYEVELHSFAKRSVQGTISERRVVDSEPHTHLTLYVALLKGKKLDIVLQKGTELGVSRFVPFLSQRSIINSLKKLSDAKMDRWESIIREAAEQSGRGCLPELSDPQFFEVALSETRTTPALSLIAWEKAGGKSLKQLLKPVDGVYPTRLNLFIGPEGGFEEQEILIAQAYDVLPITLGRRILRAETASIAAVSAILYELGEWQA